MVLFVTGKCLFNCYYCPISKEKKGRDVIFADEMRVMQQADLLEEAKAIDATGVGITGGDPLAAIDRTIRFVRFFKREFGKEFHIHLYTMDTNVKKIIHLAKTGVDEIRFHPPMKIWGKLERSSYNEAIATAIEYNMDVGLEVPLIPDHYKDLIKMIKWAESKNINFVNMNEMELSDSNEAYLKAKGYRVGKGKFYGIAGCDSTAKRILSRSWSVTVHYCTSAYKDSWQLRERIKRRAKSVAQPWDVVTEDGTIIKGVIEGSNLTKIRRILYEDFRVPKDLIWYNRKSERLEVAPWILERIANHLDIESYIIEEYPTSNHLEVERRKIS